MFRFNSGSFDYNEKNFPIHDENLFNKLSKEIDTVIDEWKCNQTMKGAYKLFGRISVWIDVLSIAVSLFSLIIDGQRRLNKMMKKLKKRLDVKKFQDVEQFSNTFAMAITSMHMNIDGYFKSIITIIQEVEIIPMVDSYEYKFSEKFNVNYSHLLMYSLLISNFNFIFFFSKIRFPIPLSILYEQMYEQAMKNHYPKCYKFCK